MEKKERIGAYIIVMKQDQLVEDDCEQTCDAHATPYFYAVRSIGQGISLVTCYLCSVSQD